MARRFGTHGLCVVLLFFYCNANFTSILVLFSHCFIFQPYAHLTNEQVWFLVDSGGHIDRPACCPGLLFSSIIEPCFAFVPADRPTFAMLVDYFLILNVNGSEPSEDIAYDNNFPRIDTDRNLRGVSNRSSGFFTFGAPETMTPSGSEKNGVHDILNPRLSEILKSAEVFFSFLSYFLTYFLTYFLFFSFFLLSFLLSFVYFFVSFLFC